MRTLEEEWGSEHPSVIPFLCGLGKARLELGDASDAILLLDRARGLSVRHQPGALAFLSTIDYRRARALWLLGEEQRARRLAEEALRLLRSDEGVEFEGLDYDITTWLESHEGRGEVRGQVEDGE